jgi:microsomal dipeptidase-like Zn-dependent dipeptidase
MEELTRVASQAGFGEGDLEKIAFDNASRLWPEEVAAREPKQAPDEDGRK